MTGVPFTDGRETAEIHDLTEARYRRIAGDLLQALRARGFTEREILAVAKAALDELT